MRLPSPQVKAHPASQGRGLRPCQPRRSSTPPAARGGASCHGALREARRSARVSSGPGHPGAGTPVQGTFPGPRSTPPHPPPHPPPRAPKRPPGPKAGRGWAPWPSQGLVWQTASTSVVHQFETQELTYLLVGSDADEQGRRSRYYTDTHTHRPHDGSHCNSPPVGAAS
jgi:hypothetical protein